ncbi:hypothetical protein SESBI_45752 [Sesbania bispinosa]|nr:hypothetical protein SESBI_45752 [Sesbania bispinosa]
MLSPLTILLLLPPASPLLRCDTCLSLMPTLADSPEESLMDEGGCRMKSNVGRTFSATLPCTKKATSGTQIHLAK